MWATCPQDGQRWKRPETRIQQILQLYTGSVLAGLEGAVVRFVRERPLRHDEPADTFDVPRDKLGLLALLGGGCNLL